MNILIAMLILGSMISFRFMLVGIKNIINDDFKLIELHSNLTMILVFSAINTVVNALGYGLKSSVPSLQVALPSLSILLRSVIYLITALIVWFILRKHLTVKTKRILQISLIAVVMMIGIIWVSNQFVSNYYPIDVNQSTSRATKDTVKVYDADHRLLITTHNHEFLSFIGDEMGNRLGNMNRNQKLPINAKLTFIYELLPKHSRQRLQFRYYQNNVAGYVSVDQFNGQVINSIWQTSSKEQLYLAHPFRYR